MSALYKFLPGNSKRIDWTLLLLLVFLLNVKMFVKIAALLLLLLLHRRMWKEKYLYRQTFAWFYGSLVLIALLNLLVSGSFSPAHIASAATGMGYWLICMAAALLNYQFVLKTETGKLHATITLFFILNAVVTILQLLLIQWDAGSINPYTYQGMQQKYFIGTGDLLTGISFDVSNTNALLGSFGLVYFLSRHKISLTLLSLLVLLFTASNLITILTFTVLLFLFIFQSTRDQKSILVICFALLLIFTTKISPQNSRYVTDGYQKIMGIKEKKQPVKKDALSLPDKPDDKLTSEERKRKTAIRYVDSLKKERARKYPVDLSGDPAASVLTQKPVIPGPDIHSKPFQRNRQATVFQTQLLSFAISHIPLFDTSQRKALSRTQPGKLIALQQTIHYLQHHPENILTGAGMGNFSSKLAFRTTGLGMAGGYPEKFIYIHPAFRDNHLRLYLDYFSKDAALHSVINSPNSVYDQLIAEYGMAGGVSFIVLYLGYFLKRIKRSTYGIPLLLIMTGAFATGYWYEQLSIVILFELLMLLDRKETSHL